MTDLKNETGLPRYFSEICSRLAMLDRGRLDLLLPDGRVFRAEGPQPGPVAQVNVNNADVFSRLIREGDLGFAEAYLDGWWDSPDLQSFMDLLHADNTGIYDDFPGAALVRVYEQLRHWLRRNHKSQAKKNIAHHYDLGNAFYEIWLDETMTYSSAIFETGQESHEAAQRAKYKSMVDQMGVKPGDHVLEIGCGWGGFADYAASERGLKVTGLTISSEQHDYAVNRMKSKGLSDKVEIRLQDYRDTAGQFDGIASIEMFEAVGEKYWPVYFKTLRNRLKPGKCATAQIITISDEQWRKYRGRVDFIQKYIFPGGMLPGPTILREQITKAGLGVERSIEFGESYSLSLKRWYETFNARWDDIAPMGFDNRFRRMWNLYLTSCASAFASGRCDVTQITMRKPS